MNPSNPHNSDDFPTRMPSDENATKLPVNASDADMPEGWHLPKRFGRYRVDRFLSRGGFGEVYQAFDEDLQRSVAIKVTFGKMLDSQGREEFLNEARIVAALEHPHIVPVHDVGTTENGDYFVVSKLIDGTDLAARIKTRRPELVLSLQIVEAMADALHTAHAKGIVHRDVKPANILLDRKSFPYLTDFGIALRETDARVSGQQVGTPAYMSPEQARGEGHRVDNRSDIYSLGVVLYELLAGRRPFRSENQLDLIRLIATEEVRTPRLFEESIPVEIERICLKAVARRASDRFQVAKDMAEEIRWWLDRHAGSQLRTKEGNSFNASGIDRSPQGDPTPIANTPSPMVMTPKTPSASRSAPGANHDSQRTGPTKVVPKGLRSFDANDAEFFLELLPGPFDRTGLPESLRFWKTRIEKQATQVPFKVGLIYGPSGCGKSSLMKAGLLPGLTESVLSVYIEATSDDTEKRLLSGVRRAIPDAEGKSLTEVLANVRRAKSVPTSGKLLLVIDQFEQWLHAEKDYAKSELANALRQCDGQTIQAIVMVRDDFWLSVSRFLREIEVPIIEGENSAMVDLFDLDHATKVLGLFGRAHGRLPASTSQWTPDQHQFLKQAVLGLAEDRKVVSVRLAIFSDMMRTREWSLRSLKEVGGIDGVGVTFLDETFSSKHSPPENRYHELAARGLLAALLPDRNSDIKGSRQSLQVLMQAANYTDKPRDFSDLLQLLDQRLRLITPADTGQWLNGEEVKPGEATASHYQLTHDYLVPSLRQWIVKKQLASPQGRAELKLQERAQSWRALPENRQLPSLIEWLGIRWRTQSGQWTEPQQAMMQAAGRYYGLRVFMAMFGLIAIGLSGVGIREYWSFQTKALLAEQGMSRRVVEEKRLLDGLRRAELRQVSAIIEDLKPFSETALPKLTDVFVQEADDAPGKLNAAVALIALAESPHPEAAQYLMERLLVMASPQQVGQMVQYLLPIRDIATKQYAQSVQDLEQPKERRFRAGVALAQLHPESSLWQSPSLPQFLAEEYAEGVSEQALTWQELMQPIGSHLSPALARVVKEPSRSKGAKANAVAALLAYAKDDHALLVDVVLETDPVSSKAILPILSHFSEAATLLLEEALREPLLPIWNDTTPATPWVELSNSQIEAIEAAHGQVSSHWAYCQDMPVDQFLQLIESLRSAGYRPIRVRPTVHETVTIAAVWRRDSMPWKLDVDLPKSVLPAPDEAYVEDGLVFQDAGIWPSTTEEGKEPRFFVLWTGQTHPQDKRCLLLAENQHELEKYHLRNLPTNVLLSLHCQNFLDGQRHYSAIWSLSNDSYQYFTQAQDHDMIHRVQVDVSLAAPLTRPDYDAILAWELENTENKNAAPEDAGGRSVWAMANFYAGNYSLGLALMDAMRRDGVETTNTELYRIACLARLGRHAEAASEEAVFLENPDNLLFHDLASVIVVAAKEEWSEAFELIRTRMAANATDGNIDYNLACAAALCAEWCSSGDIDPAPFKNIALELLQRSWDRGYKVGTLLLTDLDLRSLSDEPAFLDYVAKNLNRHIQAAVFHVPLDFESHLVFSSEEDAKSTDAKDNDAKDNEGWVSRSQLEPWLSQGYRPRAVQTVWLPGESPDEEFTLRSAILLSRPLISSNQRMRWTERRVNAAMALLSLQRADKAWELCDLASDRETRSSFQDRLVESRIPLETLLERWAGTPDSGQRIVIALTIGEQAKAAHYDDLQLSKAVEALRDHFEDDPHPGVHMACEWALTQCKALESITNVRKSFATGNTIGLRQWYITKNGHHTMVCLPSVMEFEMGSPISEAGRWEGPTGTAEGLHRRSISRSFAISSKEVSVKQYKDANASFQPAWNYADSDECPVQNVSWNQAAQYCNWLSEKEGIPSKQWCYYADPNDGGNMMSHPDFLDRQGYRLPTETEWEFACRANSSSPYYTGYQTARLTEHEWILKNTDGIKVYPVGLLQPSPWGLYDTLGNVSEWCEDVNLDYDFLIRLTPYDLPTFFASSINKIARGGSFTANLKECRAACRYGYDKVSSNPTVGFRVARTRK